MKTTTGNQHDFTKSSFWAFDVEINTDARRKDIPYSLSDAEIILDALKQYRNKQVQELEWLRVEWPKLENVTLPVILESFATGEFARTMEQIKVCDLYIDIISDHLGANLRQIGNSISAENKPD